MLRTDQNHPLTQAALTIKASLLGLGWENGPATDLEAVKTAIADRPELAAQARPVTARDASRVSALSAQGDVTGTTVRRTPASTTPSALSKRELEIAARMGVKDPAKAKERFMKRNAEGRSGVTPQIVGIVREEA